MITEQAAETWDRDLDHLWQLAEHAGHATPVGLQAYVAEHLGRPDEVLIIDDTGS
ncbi:hypothetical protein [Streptomyces sp. 11x1]|uniref:hypothetical protein n=1 Tax=Streptomyces sp. 11x1 TaxID=3038642 RepID=UPI0037D9FC63